MEQRRVGTLAGAVGVTSEEVVVLETVAPIDEFVTAVNKIPGLEWLGEIDQPDIPPDPDFFDPAGSRRVDHIKTNSIHLPEPYHPTLVCLWVTRRGLAIRVHDGNVRTRCSSHT